MATFFSLGGIHWHHFPKRLFSGRKNLLLQSVQALQDVLHHASGERIFRRFRSQELHLPLQLLNASQKISDDLPGTLFYHFNLLQQILCCWVGAVRDSRFTC